MTPIRKPNVLVAVWDEDALLQCNHVSYLRILLFMYVSCLCLWALLPDLNKMMMMMMILVQNMFEKKNNLPVYIKHK